jgi:hypothetical protein
VTGAWDRLAKCLGNEGEKNEFVHTGIGEHAMKFICLGYMEEKAWDAMPKTRQDAVIEECFAYDDKLRKNGHWVDGGQALQTARTAVTLRWKNGKVVVTDGPFAETKEQLGGIGVLETRDMDQAVELLSKHPGVRLSPFAFEIRPADEELLKRQMASEMNTERRSAAAVAPGTEAETMKFACLGYVAEENWDAISKSEQDAMIEECTAFDEARRKNGQWVSGVALQGVRTAKTVRSKGGQVVVTDGPYAETKEHLGGIVVMGMKDMNHAIGLLSTHPGLRFSVAIEIRPADKEMDARWEARQDRFKDR